jgi:hypothetical protein
MADACKGHGLFEDELYTGDRRVSSGACACTAIIANDGFCGLSDFNKQVLYTYTLIYLPRVLFRTQVPPPFTESVGFLP